MGMGIHWLPKVRVIVASQVQTCVVNRYVVVIVWESECS